MASWTLALSQARAANAFSAQCDIPGPTEKPNTLPGINSPSGLPYPVPPSSNPEVQERLSKVGVVLSSLLCCSHSHAGIHALAILLVLQPCLSQVDGEHTGDPD